VKGCAGLGNRLATLCCAIEYAKKTKRILFVDWSDGVYGKKLVNVFPKYFRTPTVRNVNSIQDIKGYNILTKYPRILGDNPNSPLYDLYLPSSSKWLLRVIPPSLLPKGKWRKIHRHWFVRNNFESIPKKSDLRSIQALFNSDSIPFGQDYKISNKFGILFFADYSPSFKDITLSKHVDLSPSVKLEIDNYIKRYNLDKFSIGIHIRNRDKMPSRPLKTIIDILCQPPFKDRKIFLATDDKKIETFFFERFQNVITYPKNFCDNSDKGIHLINELSNDEFITENHLKESILDMWILSKCEYLFFQGNSYFSRISKILHDDPSKCFDWLTI